MKNVIPILSIIFAALCLACSVTGLIAVSVAVSVPFFGILAVPIVIVGGVASALCTSLAAIFVKAKLCRIALVIDVVSVVISIVAFAVWLALL